MMGSSQDWGLGRSVGEINNRGTNVEARLNTNEKEGVAMSLGVNLYSTPYHSCASERLCANVLVCVCRETRNVDTRVCFYGHRLQDYSVGTRKAGSLDARSGGLLYSVGGVMLTDT